jgi:uncharacterized membrane protein YoaK (UPF0700 family)
MGSQDDKLEFTKTTVAVALTFIAGYVDSLGWLSLDRVFTAQMSGNAVLLAIHIAAGESRRAWLQADSIAAFSLGLVVSGSVIEIGMRRQMRRIFAVALGIECLMLAIFAGAASLLPGGQGETDLPNWPVYALVAVVAFAMGAQNTSLRMAGILSVFTTHVTGALTGFSEEIIVCCFALLHPGGHEKPHGGFASESLRAQHRSAFKTIRRSALLLAGFFLGALAAASLSKTTGVSLVMLVPLALLAGVGFFDWLRPLTAFPSAPERR